MTGSLLITRALNYLQRLYAPSYRGLRALAESTSVSIRDNWTIDYIDRRFLTRRRQAYWKFSGLKGTGENGRLEYRQFVAGSPATTLSECLLISRLAGLDQFTRHPAVYSYLWPQYSNSSHMFSYFINGYRWRERMITDAVAQSSNAICVILDLKSFYPSVEKARVRQRFVSRFSSGFEASSPLRDSAVFLVDQLLDFPGDGLPIGPPLSHILGNVALENVDEQMSTVYPGRYFRYVDDVVILVDVGKEKEAVHRFKALIAAEKFTVNDTKTDFLLGREWSSVVNRRETYANDDQFSSLLRRLQFHLALHHKNFEVCRDMFRNEGFSLPFSRLRSVSTHGRFRRFLKALWRVSGVWQKYVCDSPGLSDSGGGRIMVPEGGPKDEPVEARSVGASSV